MSSRTETTPLDSLFQGSTFFIGRYFFPSCYLCPLLHIHSLCLSKESLSLSSLWSPMSNKVPPQCPLLQAEQTDLQLFLHVCHVPQPLPVLAALHILQKMPFMCYNTAQHMCNESLQYTEFWQPGGENTGKWHGISLFTFVFPVQMTGSIRTVYNSEDLPKYTLQTLYFGGLIFCVLTFNPTVLANIKCANCNRYLFQNILQFCMTNYECISICFPVW